MLIKVTESHIKNGEKNHCLKCPVALAIDDTLDQRIAVVHDDYIRINLINIETPNSVKTWINNFDNGEKVEPFEFELNYG